LLGTLELRTDADGASLKLLLRQPKRLALLVYLRLRAPSGPVRRDTLLGLFWPDLPQDRARRALSQSLYILRRSLGNGLVDAGGQELVAVDPSGIWCDASRFEEALAAGNLEEALSLYRGDLLEGFYLPDASEFERWLDEQRTRLRNRAAEAATALAERDSAAGALGGALHWARRAAELLPYDERAAARVVELLLASGDRSGARAEFRRYRDRLRDELEIEPPDELERSLFAERTEPKALSDTVGPPLQPRAQPAPSQLELEARSQRSNRRRTGRKWRVPAVAGVVLAASVLLTALVANQSIQGPRGGTARVLVAAVTNPTGDSVLAPLARMAGDWLSTELARTSRVRVVPPVHARQVLTDVAAEVEGDTSSLAMLLAAAARTDASLVLGGSVRGTADTARFEMFGLDPVTGEFAFVLSPIPVTITAANAGLEELREAVLVALAVHLDERLRPWMARASPPPTYESYRRYSDALDLFLEGTWAAQEEAIELLIDAWRADTTFTVPLIWALLGMLNTDQGDRADSIAHTLEAGASSLAEWDHAMLRYVLAWLHGDLRARYRWASEIVGLAPNSEWRILLAKTAADVGCRDEALAILQAMDTRSGLLDRGEFGYWQLRLDMRHLLGDTDGELRDASLAEAELGDELYPGHSYRVLVARIRAAAKVGDVATLERLLGEVRSQGRGAHAIYLMLFYWGPFDLAADRPERRIILDSAWAWYEDRTPDARTTCWYRNARFNILYQLERWAEAERALDEVIDSGCLPWGEYGMYRAPLAAHRGDVDRARAITDSFPWTSHMGTVQLGSRAFWKARVEAIAGEPAQAIVHLRAANRTGVPYSALYENTAPVDFATMRDYGPLRQLLAERECAAVP
jgi:DNA-binding SARP family transcriptional activator